MLAFKQEANSTLVFHVKPAQAPHAQVSDENRHLRAELAAARKLLHERLR